MFSFKIKIDEEFVYHQKLNTNNLLQINSTNKITHGLNAMFCKFIPTSEKKL